MFPTSSKSLADHANEPHDARTTESEGIVWISGLPIASLNRSAVLDRIFGSLARNRGGWLITANVDFLQRASADHEAFGLYRKADLIVADGAPVVWASQLQGRPLPERVAGSELVWLIAERAASEGRSIYLLGGDGDSAERAARRLVERWPALRIAGWSNPWISSPPTAKDLIPIRQALRSTHPDIVYVALGSPKQEQLIDLLRPEFEDTWMMGCGISLSFIAAEVQRAPLWMQRTGLEWVHRLAQEPRRLAGRYLMRNLPFALRLLLESHRAGRAVR